MNSFPIQNIAVNKVEEEDFNKFIRNHYKVELFDFAIDVWDDAQNDAVYLFEVTCNSLTEKEKNSLSHWINEGGESYGRMTDIILQDLCCKQVIEPGFYLICPS